MKEPEFVKRFVRYLKEIPLSKKKKAAVGAVFFILIFSAVFCSYLFDFPYLKLRYADIQEGMIADFDIILKEDMTFVDREATEARLRELKSGVPSYYLMDSVRTQEAEKNFSRFAEIFRESVEKHRPFEEFGAVAESENFYLDTELLRRLYAHPNSLGLLETSERVLGYLYVLGIVKINESDADRVVVILKRDKRNALLREEVPASSLLTLKNCENLVANELKNRNLNAASADLVAGLLKEFITENIFYSPRATAQAIAKAESESDPVKFSFNKGEYLLRKGYPVTAAQINALDYLRRASIRISLSNVLGIFVYLLLLFILAKFLLDKPFLGENLRLNQMIVFYVLALFLVVFYICWQELVSLPDNCLPGLFLPMGLTAFLAGVLSSPAAAVYLTLICSAGLMLFFHADPGTVILTVFSGVGAGISLKKVERREDILKAGAKLSGIQAVAGLSVSFLYDFSFPVMIFYLIISALNAFLSAVLALGILPILEIGLNFATPFRLAELSDKNLPIFKKMDALAPGTYAHSMAVANYAEAAAREIGANALLARCGACYHDIGKIDQAEFFAENQTGINKHDDIQPNLSIVVIKSHVVNGVNKAKALRLPEEVIDIIEQHHGNSVINYFYVQALKQGKSVPTEEDYSYKTPLPQSKEAGIVMIADVVEAATRSLPSPVSVVQVEKFIDKIISDKIANDQFAESRLTFSDVNTIKSVILRMVCSNLHTRPEYPDRADAGRGKTNE
ncbi:MAG: HDIG domain-containing protein [Spirochaetia bacterium]|nr:HDIG domain-containing protein [Spirochaetia bacterium]